MSMLRTKTPPASQVTEPDAPTVALPEPEPEVAAAQAALDGLPAEWVREDFAATILRRANLQAATRKLAARIAAAEVATAVALVAVEAGEDTDEAITSLVSLKAAQGRLEAARGVLPPATTDAAAVNTVLSVAALTLQQRTPAAPAVLAYLDQMEQWRQYSLWARVPGDAPVATDADRAAIAPYEAAVAQVAQWRAGLAAWAGARVTADALPHLAAAVAYVSLAVEVAAVVATADKQTAAANSARTAAGLDWSVPR